MTTPLRTPADLGRVGRAFALGVRLRLSRLASSDESLEGGWRDEGASPEADDGQRALGNQTADRAERHAQPISHFRCSE